MAEIATRRERVVLELEDNFTSGMARAAASASLLSKELNSLSGQSVQSRGLANVSRDMDKTGVSARKAGSDIDRFSGRLGVLRDVALTIGPAFVPIGALAVPAITGLAAQMGAAAIAGGTLIAAFQGMGGALESVNKAALEPTAENLEAAQIAMQNLSPQARELVTQLQDFRPALLELRNAAGAELFPGIGRALADLEGVLPNVERLLLNVGGAAGDLSEEFAAGISGPRGREFVDFLAAEVPGALSDLGRTIGNVAAGMSELWMAFTPLNNDFSGWLLDAARSFDQWASGLSQTEGFENFVSYLRSNGPRVADAMGAIGNAVLQLAQAAAPLGGPTLAALEAVANVIGAIAGSPAGPALVALASGLALVSRSIAAIQAIKASSLFTGLAGGVDGASRSLSGMQRAAAGAAGALAGLAVVDALQGGLKDYSVGVNAMTQSILDMNDAAGSDLPANLDGLANSIDRLANPGKAEALQDNISNALGGIGNEEEYDKAIGQIEALDDALTGLVQRGQADEASNFLQGLNLSESQMQDLMGLLPQYKDALAGVANEARIAGDEAADGFRQATSAAQQFRAAVEQLNRVLSGRASMRDYEAALDDFSAAVRKNGRSLDITTAKGRENQAALDQIASSAISVAETLKGTNRTEFLQAARRDMVDAARKLGMTRDQAQALADKLGLVDRTRTNPKITADTRAALSGIGVVEGRLNEVDGKTAEPKATLDYSDVQAGINAVTNLLNSISGRSVSTTVTTHYQTTGSPPGSARFRPGLALGGSVPKTGLPYADRHLYMLADGEEIISNRFGQADRYRRALKLMNAGAPADIVRQYLANGGTTGGPQYQDRRVYNNSSSTTSVSPRVNVGGPEVRVFIGEREIRDVAVRVANGVVNAQLDHDRIMGGS